MFTESLNRRQFLAAAASAVIAAPHAAETSITPRFPLLGFIKPFQKKSYAEIADLCAEIGWDGIELPLRKGGTIEPPAVEDELPKLLDTLKKNKVRVSVLATDVDDASDPLAAKVLRAASQLGIRQYRMRHLYYDLNRPIEPQLGNFRSRLRDVAQMNAELQVQGTFQNHSGKNYVGAPVWDIWDLMRELNPKNLGVYFDIGHATLEGGLSWPLQARLVEPLLAIVSVKDFKWAQTRPRDGKNAAWKDEWCALGEGMVRPEFFNYLKKTNFRGPICTHYEYSLGAGKEMVAALQRDLSVLREWIG